MKNNEIMIVKTSNNKNLITKTSNKKIDRQNEEQQKYDHQDKQWVNWSPRQGIHQKQKNDHQGTQPTIKKWLPRCAPQEHDHCNETCTMPQNQKKSTCKVTSKTNSNEKTTSKRRS